MNLFRKYQAHILMLLFLSLSINMNAQELKPLAEMVVGKAAENGEFPIIGNAFTSILLENEEIQSSFITQDNVSYFQYDNSLAGTELEMFTLTLPLVNGDLLLDLVAVPSSFYDYIVTTSSGETYSGVTLNIKHYRGIVKGDNSSLVAISILEDGISGLISIQGEGNYSLERLEESDTYILFNDLDLNESLDFLCSTQTTENEEPEDESPENEPGSLYDDKRCIKLYYEIEYDVYQYFNENTSAVMNYSILLGHYVTTMFQNENINAEISEFKIWTSPDPYNSATINNQLNQFTNLNPTFNGDLAQLLSTKTLFNGGVAWTNSNFCSNLNYSVSTIDGNFGSQFPTYSRDVMVSTHEFGHLIGSPHTHDCRWNGNNTAIDGCSTPLGCANPGLPSSGTIMSYCHNQSSVGINFANGFGTQPGNLIRSKVNSASCLSDCYCNNNHPEYINIYNDLNPGQVEVRRAQIDINTYHTVHNSTYARYFAGNQILITPDSKILLGADYRAAIDYCIPNPSIFEYNKTDETMAEDHIDFEEISISPNPSNGVFEIRFKNQENSIIEVFNVLGEKVYTNQFNEFNRMKIDLNHLTNGVYILRVEYSDKLIEKKIVKI